MYTNNVLTCIVFKFGRLEGWNPRTLPHLYTQNPDWIPEPFSMTLPACSHIKTLFQTLSFRECKIDGNRVEYTKKDIQNKFQLEFQGTRNNTRSVRDSSFGTTGKSRKTVSVRSAFTRHNSRTFYAPCSRRRRSAVVAKFSDNILVFIILLSWAAYVLL